MARPPVRIATSGRRLPDWPRAMGEDLAAAYVALSPATLRRRVQANDAPTPIQLTEGRRVWLREDLDAWLDRKAGRVSASQGASIFETG